MPIKAGDIKLLASVVMDDVPEGGQGPSSHVIEDNKSNEIFKDISESDRARGRVNMSKVFVSVQTPDTDTYLGSNVIVARPPEDPNVSITLFTTDQVYDTRDEAKRRVEAYLNKSAEWGGYLYENHIVGQGSIQLFQRPNAEVPPIGRTLCLVLNEGKPNQVEQYVRVTRVSTVTRTFTYNGDQDYEATLVTLELSDKLRYDFLGSPSSRTFTCAANTTVVRDTLVVDAGMYAGVVPLAEPIALGDFSLRAASVYTNLVPSAQTETPIPASPPYAGVLTPVSSEGTFTYTTNIAWDSTTRLVTPGGITPSTLRISVGATEIVDRGGMLYVGTLQVGTVDYANGILTALESYGGTKTVTYKPAAYNLTAPQSFDFLVTAESRSLNISGFLNAPAAPGTLRINYMVQNQWYVLTDDGSGALRGYDSSYGAGTYSQATGDFQVTLGALPDVGSSVLVQWGLVTQATTHPEADIVLSQVVPLDIEPDSMVSPGFFSAKWTVDGVQKTANSDVTGVLSGDATGRLDVNAANVKFAPKVLPPVGTEITYEYDTGDRTETKLEHPSRDGFGKVNLNAGGTNLVPGSVIVEWNTLTDVSVIHTYTTDQLWSMGLMLLDPIQTARDNGAGQIILNDVAVGTINYATGDISVFPDVNVKLPVPVYTPQVVSGGAIQNIGDTRRWRVNYMGISFVTAASMYPNDESGWFKVRFYSATSSTRKTKKVAFAPSFPLIEGLQAQTVPGSVVLRVANAVYGDNGSGALREVTPAGVVNRGRINYATNVVDMDSWPVGGANTARRVSIVTSVGEAINSAYVFRTAAAPLRPGSLSIQYTRPGGTTSVVTANIDGTIVAPGVIGTVDYQTGVVRLGFGDLVVGAGNEGAPWYDPSKLQADGRIFKPAPVPVSSVKYTAVAYSYMPLNADLLGIDPVRLPSDGRVPIFKAGTMVVIGNTQTTNPSNPVDGAVVDLGRTRLSRAIVRDNSGAAVYLGYTTDLDTGKVTFADTSAMHMPIRIEHRIEDMVLANDVQISGQMSFTRRISHEYPVAGSYVSSALEFGDRKARVSLVFDQGTWDGVTWTDAPVGNVAPATYNTALSPIEVTNYGASTERFVFRFTSTQNFEVIGEHVGFIATGNINSVCAPINPSTGEPYFKVQPLGWGTGWAIGNILRINTVGAIAPVWVVRTTQASVEAGIDYSFDMLTRGDVDRPAP